MDLQSTVALRSGNMMPVLGLGTWKLTGEQCTQSVMWALQMGYPMIDTASDYHNHEQVGEALSKSGVLREEIFLVTKVEEDDDGYGATKEYLDQLDQNYADLMLIHRPPSKGVGADIWKGLVRAKKEGLTGDIGVSNYSIEQIDRLIQKTGVVPAVNQIEWSPFGYSPEMQRYCRSNDIIIQAYSPLTHQSRLDDGIIQELADKYGKTPAQILIRWNLQHRVVPIIKATSREHLQQNIDVFDFSISNEDMSLMDSLNEEYSSLGRKLQYV